MPVAARIVRRLLGATLGTDLQVAAERLGPASLNGIEDRMLLGRQRMRAPVRFAVGADDIRKLQGSACRCALGSARRVHVRSAVAPALWRPQVFQRAPD